MAKRVAKKKAKTATAAGRGESSANELPGWIAGYPPWTADMFLAACGAKNREAGIRLLHAKRAIEDGKPDAFKQLLAKGLGPNSHFPHDDGSLLHFAIFVRPNAKICELLLDAGADVREPGLVSAACQPGFEPVLKRLLKAGADPNNHLNGRSPIVELAIGSDAAAVSILKQMIAAGMDVNGRASVYPDNKREVKKCTGLMTAAWQGKTDIVELLLAAGANPGLKDSRGNTALDWARSGKTKGHAKVIELLESAGTTTGHGSGLGVVEILDFSRPTKQPSYKKVLSELQKLTGAKPAKVELEEGIVKGASAFAVDEIRGDAIVDEHQQAFLARGVFIFLSHDVTRRDESCIVALPTSDPYEAVTAMRTSGINSGVTSADLIGWLKKLDKKQPFQFLEIAPDLVRARFTSAVKDPLVLLKQIGKLCPDVEASKKLTANRAKQWAVKRSLYLWWD